MGVFDRAEDWPRAFKGVLVEFRRVRTGVEGGLRGARFDDVGGMRDMAAMLFQSTDEI